MRNRYYLAVNTYNILPSVSTSIFANCTKSFKYSSTLGRWCFELWISSRVNCTTPSLMLDTSDVNRVIKMGSGSASIKEMQLFEFMCKRCKQNGISWSKLSEMIGPLSRPLSFTFFNSGVVELRHWSRTFVSGDVNWSNPDCSFAPCEREYSNLDGKL